MTKRITLALAMIGLSAAAFAGGPGNNMVAPVPAGINLIAPDSTGMWEFGVTGLLMQPGNTFQYASVTPTVVGAPAATATQNASTDNDFDGGVEADVSYVFPGNSRDVTLAYTWLNLETDGNTSLDAPGVITGVFGTVFPFTSAAVGSTAEGSLNQTLNAADLTFGQLIRIGQRVDLHPFMGVGFAAIDADENASYGDPAHARAVAGDPSDITDVTNGYEASSDFTGAGPRAGIDATVHVGNGFSVVGTFAGSLLVGNLSSNSTEFDQLDGDSDQFNNSSYTAIVPELDAKLGLDYNYAFPNNANNSLDIQAGYQVVNYFDAESFDAVDTTVVNSQDTTSNFNYAGPYLRLQLNVA